MSPDPPSDDQAEPPPHPEDPVDVRHRAARERFGPESMLAQLRAGLQPGLEILRHIGDESFGSLFLAREASLRRDVVIKVLRPQYVENLEARLRFEREARTAARISHPNVVPVFRVGTLDTGVPYYIEPYLGDCTLGDKQKRVGRFQPREVRRILLQLAAALDAAHRTGFVHRDVRPGTVRCEGDSERLLLTDFGIAGVLESAGLDEDTITHPGEILGSIGYMSPEQRDGLEVTDRSDIYSLGVLGWRLLAGASAPVPAVGRNVDRSMMLSVAPDDPELVDLIERCLRESPGERPGAAAIMSTLGASGLAGGLERAWHRTPLAQLVERWVPLAVIGMLAAAIAIAGFMQDFFSAAPRVQAAVITFLAAASLAGLVITVFHGRRGRQAVTVTEVALITLIAVTWIVVTAILWRAMPAA